MGRMWQTLLLYKWRRLFGWLPIETLIRKKQEEYYKVLGECDHSTDSGKFIEFLLTAIYDTLSELSNTEQVKKLLAVIGNKAYSAKELMELVGLKHRPTFRDNYLLPALDAGIVEMIFPENPKHPKQAYRLSKKGKALKRSLKAKDKKS